MDGCLVKYLDRDIQVMTRGLNVQQVAVAAITNVIFFLVMAVELLYLIPDPRYKRLADLRVQLTLSAACICLIPELDD